MTSPCHVYELRIRGGASSVARAAFDDVEVRVADGQTVIRTPPIDTAALYGLISRIEVLGLVLTDMKAMDIRKDGIT